MSHNLDYGLTRYGAKEGEYLMPEDFPEGLPIDHIYIRAAPPYLKAVFLNPVSGLHISDDGGREIFLAMDKELHNSEYGYNVGTIKIK